MATVKTATVLQQLRTLAAREDAGRQTDRELLCCFIQRRDERAFAALLRRHGPMVLRVGQRLLPQSADAEDVFQATFLLLARKAGTLAKQDSVGGWLYGVAYRLSLKVRRAAARRRVHEGRAGGKPAGDPLRDITLREAQAAFDAALSQVPEKYRAPLVLCQLEGLTQDEAARQLGCSRSTLQRRLDAGRACLRRQLERHGLTLPAALLAATLAPSTAFAAVRPGLPEATLRAVVCGDTPSAAGAVSANVNGLVEAGLRDLAPGKLKLLSAVMLAASLFATGVSGLGGREARESPPAASSGGQAAMPAEARPSEPLPARALARMGTARFRPGEVVRSLAVTPDGKTLAVGSYDSIVRLWDVVSGKERHRLGGHRWNVYLAISPDGKTLAAGSQDHAVRIWDVATGQELHVLSGHRAGLCAVAFSPDGKAVVSAGRDEMVCRWEITDRDPLQKLVAHTRPNLFLGHKGPVWSVAYSPDGKAIASGGADGAVRLWDPATGLQLRQVPKHDGDVKAVAFAPDGHILASAGADKLVRLWDTATGKELRRLAGHEAGVEAVVFTPDGKTIVSGGDDSTIRFWDAATGKEFVRRRCRQERVTALAFPRDGRVLFAGGWDGVVRRWDPATGQEVSPTPGHQHGIYALDFLGDGRTLRTASADGTARLWDSATGRELRRIDGPRGGAWSAAFARGSLVASKKDERTVGLWDTATGKPVRTFTIPQGQVLSAALSADGRSLAVGTEVANQPEQPGEVLLWDAATGQLRHRCPGHQGGIRSLAFSPDGTRLASGSFDKTIRLWDTADGKPLRTLTGHQKPVERVVFSPDGKRLASGANETVVRLWDVATGKEERRLPGHSGVLGLAFSPDGRTLAASGWSPVVRLWELASAAERARFVGHNGTVLCLAFSSDGRSLASGGADTTGLVWDLTGHAGRALADLSPAALAAAWEELRSEDAPRAAKAVWDLAACARLAVPFLGERLKPARAFDPAQARRWIAELDDDAFATRERATQDLEKLGPPAEPLLRKALEGSSSAEVSRRLRHLLDRLQGPDAARDRLRALRAIEALEHAGTPQARQVLAALAKGQPDAEITRDAKAALGRLR